MILDNILTLIGVFAAFSALFVLLPFVIMGLKADKEKLLYNIFASLTVGAFFIILIVFALAYLRIMTFWGFFLTLLGLTVVIFYLFYRQRTRNQIKGFVEFVYLAIKGVHKRKLVLRDFYRRLFGGLWSLIKHIFCNPFKLACFLIGLAGGVYIRGYYSVTQMGYGASDIAVHTDWIKHMLNTVDGKVFANGVYPFGMHNMIAATATLFGINPITVVRFFGTVMGIYIVLALYLLLKSAFKSQAAIAIGFMFYTLSSYVTMPAFSRQSFALPQEAAMVFLFPCAVFFNEYLKEKRLKDLTYMAMAFALMIACHFYIAIVGILLIGSMFFVNIIRIIKQKIIIRLIVAALLAALFSAGPLVAANLLGTRWEPSMDWATSVITGEKFNQQTITPQEGEQSSPQQPAAPEQEKPKAKGFVNRVNQIIDDFCAKFLPRSIVVPAMLCMAFMVLFSLVLMIFKKMRHYALFLLGLAIYALTITAMASFSTLGLPEIIDAGRCIIFFSYNYAFVFGVVIEAVMLPLSLPRKIVVRIANGVVSTAMAVAFLFFVVKTGFQEMGDCSQSQYNGAVISYYKIVNNFEKDKWCIISPVDELCMIRNMGWHYELSDFLYELAQHEPGQDIRIPADNVFFFIEKRPIHPYRINNNKTKLEGGPAPEELLSLEDATVDILELKSRLGLASQIYSDYNNRRVVMAKAYYWIQEYRKYFPELTVFYEDDDIVVYRLRQTDPYALNNFSIDYGLN